MKIGIKERTIIPIVKLQPYKIRVKTKEGRDPLFLDNLDGNKRDFFRILERFLSTLKATEIIKEYQKTISAENVSFNAEKRKLSGTFKSGDYGIEADFFDTETSQTISKARKIKHSETYPFFFLFHLPASKDYGILILAFIGVHGVKSVLQDSLNKYLENFDLRIEINPIISRLLLEKYQKSRLVELRLIRYEIPRDIAEQVIDGSPKGVLEMRVFKAKRERSIRILDSIRQMLSDKDITHYELLDEKYDEIKMVIDDRGSRKTLTFAETSKFRESEILGNFTLESDNPSFDFLLNKANGYLGRILEFYGGETDS